MKSDNGLIAAISSPCTLTYINLLQEEDLIRLFGGGNGAGNVTAVRVVRDAKTNKGKGIAYVEFQARTDARMALGFDGHTLDKRAIRVSRIASGECSCYFDALLHEV